MKTMETWTTLKILTKNRWTNLSSCRSLTSSSFKMGDVKNVDFRGTSFLFILLTWSHGLLIQGLTGLDDLGVCRALLESQNWDLEAVAREHLGITGMAPHFVL